MCGIIGYIGKNNAIDIILDGLKRLEYRGYDSAGIAYLNQDREIEIVRCKGKIIDLVKKFDSKNPISNIGIGHTRWATHGSPSEENAHPHKSGNIAIVHNGIIENYSSIKKDLIKEGCTFTSETDTEVISQLINRLYSKSNRFEDAVKEASDMLIGSYAIAVLNEKELNRVICIRKDSPMVIGLGIDEFFVASDVPAFLNYTRDVIFLEDNDMAILSNDGVAVLDKTGVLTSREPATITWSPSMAEKGGYRHFMLKEMFEQPRSIADTIRGRVNAERNEVNIYEFVDNEKSIEGINRIFIVACGTSWHSALCGKYLIEEIARIQVEVDIASEFRYRKPLIGKNDLFISITQSGETADTLAVLREVKKNGAKTLTICNVVGSTASRESDYVFYTHSGPEIGVASTKAFTAQLTALYMLAIAFYQVKTGRTHNSDREQANLNNDIPDQSQLIANLLHLPIIIEEVLSLDGEIENLAKSLFRANDFLYLGRGILYPIALEGALKLKEISYIHAEGYPAGEMKHGPIALIDENMPVVALLSKDSSLYNKVISNIEEVKSRGGITVVISNHEDSAVRDLSNYFLLIPSSNKFLNPVIMAIPLQLLAYHIAVIRGCDVDQPRNLAKSVTVE